MEVKTALVLFLLHGVAISTVLARPAKPTLQQCPDKVNTGDTVTLTCVANSIEKSPNSYKWYHKKISFSDYEFLTGENRKTFTKSVTPSDAGSYVCKTVIDNTESFESSRKWLAVNDTARETWKTTCSSLWTPWATVNLTSNLEHRSQSCGEISSEGGIRNWSLKKETRTRLGTKTWTSNCSSLWTPWATENLTSNLEHRSQLCGEISSEGGIRNWSLKKETRTRQVSEIAASFRSTKPFTKTLLMKASQEYKDMKEQFEPLLQNAYKSKVASGQMKGVDITGFEWSYKRFPDIFSKEFAKQNCRCLSHHCHLDRDFDSDSWGVGRVLDKVKKTSCGETVLCRRG